MKELEQYQKTEAYKVFSRKTQDRQKGKSHRQGTGTRTQCVCGLLCVVSTTKPTVGGDCKRDISVLALLYYDRHQLGIL